MYLCFIWMFLFNDIAYIMLPPFPPLACRLTYFGLCDTLQKVQLLCRLRFLQTHNHYSCRRVWGSATLSLNVTENTLLSRPTNLKSLFSTQISSLSAILYFCFQAAIMCSLQHLLNCYNYFNLQIKILLTNHARSL